MRGIEWTDKTWNPIRGCALVSAGCANCYAMKTAHRFNKPGMAYEGLTELGPHGPRWTGKIRLVLEALDAPLHWKTPRRVFVNSMSDLFHEDVPDEYIDRMFAVMALCHSHTFQILTKRPERMQRYLSDLSDRCVAVSLAIVRTSWWDEDKSSPCSVGYIEEAIQKGPLSNVWLGVSVENQETADKRISLLLQTPAAVRWISAEPLLGAVDLAVWMKPVEFASCWEKGYKPTAKDYLRVGEIVKVALKQAGQWNRLDWVVIGGESGPQARPCDLAWIRSITDQCHAASIPVFVKQLGAHPVNDLCCNGERLKDKKGGDPAEWPADLRIREFPVVRS